MRDRLETATTVRHLAATPTSRHPIPQRPAARRADHQQNPKPSCRRPPAHLAARTGPGSRHLHPGRPRRIVQRATRDCHPGHRVCALGCCHPRNGDVVAAETAPQRHRSPRQGKRRGGERSAALNLRQPGTASASSWPIPCPRASISMIRTSLHSSYKDPTRESSEPTGDSGHGPAPAAKI